MALDRKSANARRDLQHGHSPTFVQKREIFERFTRKTKLLKVIFLPRPIGATYMFGLSCHHNFTFNGLGKAVNPRGYCPWFYKISYSPTPFLRTWKNLANFPLPRDTESSPSTCIPRHIPLVGPGSYPWGKPMTCAQCSFVYVVVDFYGPSKEQQQSCSQSVFKIFFFQVRRIN